MEDVGSGPAKVATLDASGKIEPTKQTNRSFQQAYVGPGAAKTQLLPCNLNYYTYHRPTSKETSSIHSLVKHPMSSEYYSLLSSSSTTPKYYSNVDVSTATKT